MGDSDMVVGGKGRKSWWGRRKRAAGRDGLGRCDGRVYAACERRGHEATTYSLFYFIIVVLAGLLWMWW